MPIEVSVATFQRAEGQHTTDIIRDTTLRKQMGREREAVAQRTQQIQKLESLGVLAGGIAHDFNNLITVLVVDDEDDVRETFGLFLEQGGYQVVSARDGVEALATLAEGPMKIDCVLLDLVMPKMNGEETLRSMRRLREDLPIILTSGYSAKEIEMEFLDDNPTVFLQKPFKMSVLLDTVSRVYRE